MTGVEMELIRWRDNFIEEMQTPGTLDRAIAFAETNYYDGKEFSLSQICSSYIKVIDCTLYLFYEKNKGKCLSAYYSLNKEEVNSIMDVCDKVEKLGIVELETEEGKPENVMSRYSESDRKLIYGVITEAINLFFDYFIKYNTVDRKNFFIALSKEFMEKIGITDKELVDFGMKLKDIGIHITNFTTVDEFEDQYYKMYPEKLDIKPNSKIH